MSNSPEQAMEGVVIDLSLNLDRLAELSVSTYLNGAGALPVMPRALSDSDLAILAHHFAQRSAPEDWWGYYLLHSERLLWISCTSDLTTADQLADYFK